MFMNTHLPNFPWNENFYRSVSSYEVSMMQPPPTHFHSRSSRNRNMEVRRWEIHSVALDKLLYVERSVSCSLTCLSSTTVIQLQNVFIPIARYICWNFKVYLSAEYHAASLQQVFFLFQLAELARPALFNNWRYCYDEEDKRLIMMIVLQYNYITTIDKAQSYDELVHCCLSAIWVLRQMIITEIQISILKSAIGRLTAFN